MTQFTNNLHSILYLCIHVISNYFLFAMKCKKCLSEFIKLFDLFSVTQFLRYNQDEDYKTVSGGVTSLLIVTIFTILFASNAVATVNKTEIFSSSEVQNLENPKPSNLTFDSNSKLMFAIGINGLNLNDPSIKYFDIQMYLQQIRNESFSYPKVIEMEPCTKEHFRQSEQIYQNYDNMRMTGRVCAPLNSSFQISGKYSSNLFQTVELRISPCNSNNTNASRPCISNASLTTLISAFGEMYASLAYVRPLINPGKADYLRYYVDDSNFFAFTSQVASFGIGYVKDYTIQTDQSLLPFTDQRIQTGLTINEPFQILPNEVGKNHGFGGFILFKSSSQTTYKRSFNKADEFFSYVGGLIGTILGFMFFMSNFSLMSFELDIARRFFLYEKGQKTKGENFNLFTYMAYIIYKVGSYCGLCQGWQSMRKTVECKEEMLKQLDVQFILQRISFLQRVIDYLIQKKKIQQRPFYQLQTLRQLKKRRRKYRKMKDRTDEQDDHSSSSQEEEQSRGQQFKLEGQFGHSQQHLDLADLQEKSQHKHKNKKGRHREKGNKQSSSNKKQMQALSPDALSRRKDQHHNAVVVVQARHAQNEYQQTHKSPQKRSDMFSFEQFQENDGRRF